jgi:hypothetical protein
MYSDVWYFKISFISPVFVYKFINSGWSLVDNLYFIKIFRFNGEIFKPVFVAQLNFEPFKVAAKQRLGSWNKILSHFIFCFKCFFLFWLILYLCLVSIRNWICSSDPPLNSSFFWKNASAPFKSVLLFIPLSSISYSSSSSSRPSILYSLLYKCFSLADNSG